MKLKDLYELWTEGRNVPVDDNGIIQSEWAGFPAGTDREEIWHWFEEQNPLFVVGKIINEGPRGLFTESERLDETVCEEKARQAETINNLGVEDQVSFLKHELSWTFGDILEAYEEAK